MGHPPRIVEPDGYYHVTAVGNDGRTIYPSPDDARSFLDRLARAVRRYDWVCLTHCLMTNHYHLLLRLPAGGPSLSRGMQELNGHYSRATNKRYGRKHHLFRNRFGARHITTEKHLLEACRYIVLNPVRAGLVAHPADWPWSSYTACANDRLAPAFLARDELLRLFDDDARRARRAYREFVEDRA
ncbi:MAG: transposase [Actinomycetota bacterium]|nr:transposase [Actinomycetota bacterium]